MARAIYKPKYYTRVRFRVTEHPNLPNTGVISESWSRKSDDEYWLGNHATVATAYPRATVKYEWIEDVKGFRQGNNPVDHITIENKSFRGFNYRLASEQEVRTQFWDYALNAWNYATVIYTHYLWGSVNGYVPSGFPVYTENTRPTVPHITSGIRIHGSIESILEDATSSLPTKTNLLVSALEATELKKLVGGVPGVLSKIKSVFSPGSMTTYVRSGRNGIKAVDLNGLSENRVKRLRTAGKLVGGTELFYQWAVKPLVDDINAIRTLNSRCLARVAVLAQRDRQPITTLQRSWTETETQVDASGTTITIATSNTISAKKRLRYNINYDNIINKMYAHELGLDRLLNSIWSVMPLSFVYDWFDSSIDDISGNLDELIKGILPESLAQDVSDYNPTTVETWGWTLSQNTITQTRSKTNWTSQMLGHPHGLPQVPLAVTEEGWECSRYTRSPVSIDLDKLPPSMSLGSGQWLSLGILVATMRL